MALMFDAGYLRIWKRLARVPSPQDSLYRQIYSPWAVAPSQVTRTPMTAACPSNPQSCTKSYISPGVLPEKRCQVPAKRLVLVQEAETLRCVETSMCLEIDTHLRSWRYVMELRSQVKAETEAVGKPRLQAIQNVFLQRMCACGQHSRGGECEECSKKRTAEKFAPASMVQ